MIEYLISTLIIALIIPVFGFILDSIIGVILNITSRHLGHSITWFIANRLTFIGTVHHELSHALFAFLTGAKIVKIDFFHPEGNTLGKVIFKPRGNKILQSIQVALSAIAPILLGILTISLLYIYALPSCIKLWQYIIVIYLMISIVLHMTMSKQDIKNAIKGAPICILIIFIVVYIFKINFVNFI